MAPPRRPVTAWVPLVAMVTLALSAPARSQGDDDMGACLDRRGGVCGSVGQCVHGECQCPNPYYGRLCQHVHRGSCEATKQCVQCTMFNTGPLAEDECALCSQPGGPIQAIYLVDRLYAGEKLCQFRGEDDCVLEYTTSEGSSPGRYHVEVLRKPHCSVSVQSNSGYSSSAAWDTSAWFFFSAFAAFLVVVIVNFLTL